jgi:hypothetical protein
MYDLFQNFRIKQTSSEATDAKYAARNASISIKELQDKVDYMSVVVTAMCELLENVGFTEETLLKKIQEVDMRDGRMDGKYQQTKKCSECGRIMAERHLTCIYCGAVYSGN